MKNRICTKFACANLLQISTLYRFAPIAKVVVAKFAQNVQTWQPPLMQWVETFAKLIFGTGLHKANFVQIRFIELQNYRSTEL